MPELALTGLAQESAAALVDSHGPDLSPAIRYRLLAEAGGDPLALLEPDRSQGWRAQLSSGRTSAPAKRTNSIRFGSSSVGSRTTVSAPASA